MRPSIALLGDICDIRSGGTPLRSTAAFYGGSIPWAKISDIERSDGNLIATEETLTVAGLDAIRGRMFSSGSLLFAIYGSIGKMAFAGMPISTNQAILGLEFKDPSVVNPRYIFHWLLANNSRFLRDGQGIAQKNLSAGYLRELQLPLPPLDEQRRIAAILDKADALRRKRRRALDLLDGLTQSIFLEMFGDADRNRFPVVEIGKVIAEGPSNGLYKPSSAYGVGTPILRINNFYDGAITSLDELRRLTLEESEIDRFELKEDDIVINRVNSREYVGKSAIVPALNERTVYESNMMRFSVRDDEALPTFVIQALQTSAVQRQIQSKTKDAINQSSINQKDVRSLRIVLPPIGEQRRFAQAVHFLAATRSVQRDGGGAHALFASLQHRAFNGQL